MATSGGRVWQAKQVLVDPPARLESGLVENIDGSDIVPLRDQDRTEQLAGCDMPLGCPQEKGSKYLCAYSY